MLIAALLSERGRSHCPCIAIRWGRTSRCCRQHGRTGSSALWLCRSHYRGIGSQKGRRSHCFPLLETSGSTEQEKPRARGLLRKPGQHRGALAFLATSQKANPPKPTATQSISGDEATEKDPQGAEREGFEPSTEVASCNSLAGSRFQPLSHLSISNTLSSQSSKNLYCDPLQILGDNSRKSIPETAKDFPWN